MRAVTLDFGRRLLLEREISAPAIARGDQVLFRVEEVGVVSGIGARGRRSCH
jgi:hypothetical protein